MHRGKYEKMNPPTAPVLNVAMCLALVLFALVAVTVYLAQGLYARYITQDTGSDSARVMKFGQLTLKENGDANALNQSFLCIPGVNIAKDITVSFTESEADVFVFVVADTTGWDTTDDYHFSKSVTVKEELRSPLATWSVNSTDWTLCATETKDGKTVHVYFQRLDANTALADSHFIAENTVFVREATREEYAVFAGQSLCIDVTAYAVQANGFEREQDAWAALKKK